MIPALAGATRHRERTAVVAPDGDATYASLLERSGHVAAHLLDDSPDLGGAPVAFLVSPGVAWVATLWGIWRAGGIAVPLAPSHPPAELARTLRDARAALLVSGPCEEPAARAAGADLGTRVVCTSAFAPRPPRALPEVAAARPALLVYTSGTTSAPKGVVLTHAMLAAQIESLHTAWEWSADDRILNVLPLHHVHGLMAVVGCALAAGATCEMTAGFDADAVWRRLAAPVPLTLFMAVPTIYARLVDAWNAAPPAGRAAMTAGCRRLRLMVSGSAALPGPILERWRAISGHTLLERYGMTEFGLALANPLRGERRPGWVGRPLPGVAVRLVDDRGRDVADGVAGELLVRGAAVFREYWQRPQESATAFTREGWFRTGDVAERRDGWYRILGRTSVDIIKTGGYKVSALEIEHALLAHQAIERCAVVGLPDDAWGERVTAAVVLRDGHALELDGLRAWARTRLAPYKVPRRLAVLDALPCNTLGKVNKPALVRRLTRTPEDAGR